MYAGINGIRAFTGIPGNKAFYQWYNRYTVINGYTIIYPIYLYIGVWNYLTGKLKFTLAKATLGAIITIAIITEDGKYLATAESNELGKV